MFPYIEISQQCDIIWLIFAKNHNLTIGATPDHNWFIPYTASSWKEVIYWHFLSMFVDSWYFYTVFKFAQIYGTLWITYDKTTRVLYDVDWCYLLIGLGLENVV